MTDRLYYHDSFLYEFDARVVESVEHEGKHSIVLDRTAFYPTSGGQPFGNSRCEVRLSSSARRAETT